MKDGGPAFPTAHNQDYLGLTIRDWFAGQALAGFTASDTDFSGHVKIMAETAYALADAMLAAREGVNEHENI